MKPARERYRDRYAIDFASGKAAELITLSEYKRFGRNVYRISRLGEYFRRTCFAGLSSRSAMNFDWRRWFTSVQSAYSICATSCGFNQRHSAILSAVNRAAAALDPERAVSVEFYLIFPNRPFRQFRCGKALHGLDETRWLSGALFWNPGYHRDHYSNASIAACSAIRARLHRAVQGAQNPGSGFNRPVCTRVVDAPLCHAGMMQNEEIAGIFDDVNVSCI